jgi:hypothetical protein
MRNAKPSTKGTSPASKPRMSATKPKSSPKAGTTGKPAEDWHEETLARMRALILKADPEMIEERKWKKPSNGMVGVPVWSHNGIVCTGETYKNAVKLTFAKGAALEDSSGLFNSSLDGNVRRAIDIQEGEKIDQAAFKDLIRAAVALNLKGESKPKPPPRKRSG